MTDPFSSAGAKAPPKPFTATEGRREIRSFVLRQGRFTEAQQRAFDALWPRYGLDYAGQPRDFDAAFGRSAPRVLEIGFGNGEALRFAAARDPLLMASAMRKAVEAGREAFLAGRIPRKRYASASSPVDGLIG